MKFSVISAFPEFFETFFSTSIIGRAAEKGLISYELLNPRNFAEKPHHQIDDYAYGGGGMVMMAEPLAKAVEAAEGDEAKVVFLSPQGRRLDQGLVEELAAEKHLVLLCGHYEGVDERFVEAFVDMEVSIGDFVLTGGEIPAMALMDALSRRIPGVVGRAEAVEEDSFFRGMLDTPHYTRPAEWRGKTVPEVLLSGNHGVVDHWRREKALRRTLERRPDLLESANIRPYLQKGVYVLFAMDLNKAEQVDPVICAMVKDAAALGCEKAFLVDDVPKSGNARNCIKRLKEKLPENLSSGFLKPARGIQAVSEWVKRREKNEPYMVHVGFFRNGTVGNLRRLKREVLEKGEPVVFCFGSVKDDIKRWTLDFQDIKTDGQAEEPNLSLPGSLAVTLDLFFGFTRC